METDSLQPWERVRIAVLQAPEKFLEKISQWRTREPQSGLIMHRAIGGPNAVIYRYGRVVNDSIGITFEIYPDFLNDLSEDRRVGMNIPNGHFLQYC